MKKNGLQWKKYLFSLVQQRIPILRSALILTLVLCINGVFGQTGSTTISGKVVDFDGKPLLGVSVYIKGTTFGTITQNDGSYQLKANPGETLVFSFIGYLAEEVAIADQNTVDIMLIEDILSLEDVVVIGYGTQMKKDLTSAISTVSSNDFKVQHITDVDQILQGRSAGVSVVKSSGAPGGQAKIRIRGSNSISGTNDPLYVIDGFVGGDFNTLSPDDIESVQILKDASATAIYGSRGANGVVLVTTKNGKMDENKITFRATLSGSEVINRWDLLSAGDYAKTANEYNTALGNSPIFTNDEVNQYYDNGGTDWQDEVFRNALGQDYQLTLSGGNSKSTYYVSGNVMNQEGIVINSYAKRYSLRTNVSSNITDNFKATFRTNYSHQEAMNTGGGGDFRNTLSQMLAWAPTTPARDNMGNITPQDPTGSTFESPLELATNKNLGLTNTYTTNGNLVYTFFPGLSLDVGFGANYANSESNTYNQGLLLGLTSDDAATAARNAGRNVHLVNTNILTYKKVFNDIHNLTLTAVNEQSREVMDNFGVSVIGTRFPEFEYNNLSLLSSGGTIQGTAYYGRRDMISYVGRASYILMNKYYLSASVRHDGSSVFQEDNKWATFPSVSVGWTLSEENFLSTDVISNLKLRASWGQTGNQAVRIYGTQSVLTTGPPSTITTSFVNGQGTAGILVGDFGNDQLKWETTDQINAGVDASILDNRFSLTADYFKKNTHDLLLYMPVPSYMGGGGRFENIGEVENTGWEFVINALAIEKSDFKWNSSFNATFMKNKIITLGRDEYGIGNNGGGEGHEFIIREGESIGSFYGLNYLGVWKEGEEDLAAIYGAVPGDARFEDLQNPGEAGYGVIDSEDKQVIGNSIPKGIYGWSNTFTYKNFTLNFLFQALTGFDRWAFTYAEAVTPGRGSSNVEHADVLDRWDPVNNPDSDIPHFSSTTRPDILTSRFVMDASFLRLKNLSLSYDFTLKEDHKITLMLAASNLLTITKYKGLDPEAYTNQTDDAEASRSGLVAGPNAFSSQIGSDSQAGVDVGSYPNSKSYSFSIILNF